MKKNGNKSSGDSASKVPESNKKPDKVMVPFFESNDSASPVSLKPDRPLQQRKSKFGKVQSDSHPPKPHKFANRKDNPKLPAPREVGFNGEPAKPKLSDVPRNSWPSPKSKERSHHNGAPHTNLLQRETRIAYIDCNNVGNIRPLSQIYSKDDCEQVSEAPTDVVHKISREFRPSFTCDLDPIGRHATFVDALIRNSNSFEDVVVDESSVFQKTNKSQELKSVLTKMGILDKSHSQKDDSCFPELDKDLDNHYVFPKYMTSPDPSSIPIPGSL